ncbi:MAG: class I SAM-dependent RNA methyltransferase [Treponema sp.]|nr:class I SAM-dependent RNA methyltransferase [Treponema sp.]
MEQQESAVALCALGAEKVVSNELRKLGLKVTDSRFGRVRFRADLAGLYRALTALRAADRVLLEAASFPAGDFEALFEGARAVPWERLVSRGMGFAVTKVRANRSKLRAETSVQAVVHKAAAERLCGAFRIRRLPKGGETAELRVYIEKDQVSLLLDLSGEPLFKRGYRTEGGAAPLRETTAAAVLLLSNWRRKFPLYDPFCGSGTILIEAAMYAWDMAPGLGRRFALEGLPIAKRETGEAVRAELAAGINFDRRIRIFGSDTDSRALSAARSNLARALASGGRRDGPAGPELSLLPMEEARAPAGCGDTAPPGFVVTNPPYGKRIGSPQEAEATYGRMADLGKRFPGWKLALITSHPGFESFFGRKADSCRELSNGAAPSFLFQYEGL